MAGLDRRGEASDQRAQSRPPEVFLLTDREKSAQLYHRQAFAEGMELQASLLDRAAAKAGTVLETCHHQAKPGPCGRA
jgi:hypothetical protein